MPVVCEGLGEGIITCSFSDCENVKKCEAAGPGELCGSEAGERRFLVCSLSRRVGVAAQCNWAIFIRRVFMDLCALGWRKMTPLASNAAGIICGGLNHPASICFERLGWSFTPLSRPGCTIVSLQPHIQYISGVSLSTTPHSKFENAGTTPSSTTNICPTNNRNRMIHLHHPPFRDER